LDDLGSALLDVALHSLARNLKRFHDSRETAASIGAGKAAIDRGSVFPTMAVLPCD
jgi:hypothetical protein